MKLQFKLQNELKNEKFLFFLATSLALLIQLAEDSNALIYKISILTSREKEVLALIAEGLTNNQIASQLYISPLTVDSHRKKLLAKLNVKNTAAMIKMTLQYHLI